MILFLDPQPPQVAWCEVRKTDPKDPVITRTGTCAIAEVFKQVNVPDGIMYMLPHGGEEIQEPISELTPEVLAAVERAVPLFPDGNGLAIRLIREGLALHKNLPQWLLCDTAFSLALPEASACYAVPPSLRRSETRRYGRAGFGHSWALHQAHVQLPSALKKIITINIAPQTTIAAFEKDQPIEVSSGFTMAEGMISITSCGDIDPTLPIHLCASGLPVSEVNRALGEQGGLNAIAERELTFRDLFEEPGDRHLQLAQEMYAYQLVKYIGSFTAAMGGVDAIVFFGAAVPSVEPFIHQITKRISPVLPQVRVLRFGFNRWEAMANIASRVFIQGVTK
jgi:acetate kinase